MKYSKNIHLLLLSPEAFGPCAPSLPCSVDICQPAPSGKREHLIPRSGCWWAYRILSNSIECVCVGWWSVRFMLALPCHAVPCHELQLFPFLISIHSFPSHPICSLRWASWSSPTWSGATSSSYPGRWRSSLALTSTRSRPTSSGGWVGGWVAHPSWGCCLASWLNSRPSPCFLPPSCLLPLGTVFY